MELSRPYAKKSKQQYSVELSCWGGPSSPGPALECPAEFSGIFSQNSAGIKLRNSVFFAYVRNSVKNTEYGSPYSVDTIIGTKAHRVDTHFLHLKMHTNITLLCSLVGS